MTPYHRLVPATLSVIDAGLVRLRPARPDDAEALLAILAEPGVRRWCPNDAGAVERLAAPAPDDEALLAIEVGGDVVGAVLVGEGRDPARPHGTLRVFIASRWQKRGVGTRALRAVARHLVDVVGHHRVVAEPAAENGAAIRTFGAVGFRPVGVLRRSERGETGGFRDGLLMELIAAELTR